MKRILLSGLTFILSALYNISSAGLPGEWKYHFPFDQNVLRVEDTPTRTYVMSYSQPVSNYSGLVDNIRPWATIHYLDKATDTMRTLDRFGRTDGSRALCMAYNAGRGYLMVVYDNREIDFVYDDGSTFTCSDLVGINPPYTLDFKSISFDPVEPRATVLTTRGYVNLDETTHSLEEYRDYAISPDGAATLGDTMLLSYEGTLHYAPLSEPRMSLTDYETMTDHFVGALYPLTADLCGYVRQENGIWRMAIVERTEEGFQHKAYFMSIERWAPVQTRDGYLVPMRNYLGFLSREGVWKRIARAPEDAGSIAAGHDGSQIWSAARYTGLWSTTLSPEEEWTPAHPVVTPNAPSIYRSTTMAFHPTYGLLVNNRGLNRVFANINPPMTPEICAYRAGKWTPYGVGRRNPEQENTLINPMGLAIDPDNPDYVYMGSARSGILRVNIADPQDVMHFSRATDPAASLPGFVEAFPVMATWSNSTPNFGVEFDKDGTLWSYTFNTDLPRKAGMTLLFWDAESRRATTSPETFRPWGKIEVPEVKSTGSSRFKVLHHPDNANLIVLMVNTVNDRFVIYDHNGTPADTSDDRMAVVRDMRDQFGNVIPLLDQHSYDVMEDSATGLVWVTTVLGTYTFNPRMMFIDPTRARRVLTHNPATGEKGFLLDGMSILSITEDIQGRKWFATQSNGVVCTTPDGSEIIEHFTTLNSPLPSDEIYCICEDKATGSMMISTACGLVEYTPEAFLGRPESKVNVTPSAITPSFHGPVTFTGLADGAEYAIIDSGAGQVLILGSPAAMTLQWDGRDAEGLPVESGDYSLVDTRSPQRALSTVHVMR